MLASEIRRKYLEFFAERGHLQLPGANLVPVDVLGNRDDSTLFTGSGMQQFKPYFLNASLAPRTRVMTVQKCVRNKDIDSVGDFSHCTFFEMMGNFSFGDYFKAEVIPWTWEFLTGVVGVDPDRLCVTVYLDDDEAFSIWHDVIGLPVDRIHRLGEDKNYWPANAISEGPNGPCGPCSEIFYRVAPLEEMTSQPGLTPTQRYLVDDADGRYVEIWNNVFTQFDRSESPDGKAILTPLRNKNNDTGAGLDRIAYVSQGKTSVFETDLFGPTLEHIAQLSGRVYEGAMSPNDFAFRVVAEHTRTAVFCIADGITPSNEKQGYVLRYLLRRAIRYGKTVLGFDAPFLHEVAPSIIAQMGDFYTELTEKKELILSALLSEEEAFRRTLDNGLVRLERLLARESVQESRVLPGNEVFQLYSTYGFPLQLTQDIAAERGMQLDQEGYEAALKAFKEQNPELERAVFSKQGGADVLANIPPTRFLGYSQTDAEAKIVAILQNGESVESARAGDDLQIILDHTPFYAESGGQVGDIGTLTAPAGNTTCALKIDVTDTLKSGTIFLHTARIAEGEAHVGQSVVATVDADRRRRIMRNHTATHLLQAAMRTVLGSHVHQKGSLVAPDRLRFDFTHNQPISATEISRIEEMVNTQALKDTDVVVYTDLPIAEARARGAMALFGEKYGERVRMIEIGDFSRELCGGTHLAHTSQMGLFKIVSQTGVSSGVRRVEAVTGEGAYEYITRQEETLTRVAETLKSNPNDLLSAVEKLQKKQKELEHELKRQKETAGPKDSFSQWKEQYVHGIKIIAEKVSVADAENLANLVDKAGQHFQSAVIVLGSPTEGKVAFAAKVTPDLLAKGLHAGNLVREVAKITGGGGGGRPDFAQAGGRDKDKIDDALRAVPALVESQLK